MNKIILLTVALILSSCITTNKSQQQKDPTLPESSEQRKNREEVAKRDRELQRNSLGYFTENRPLNSWSMGSPDGFLAVGEEKREVIHRLFIKVVCGDSSQFTAQPVRFTNFNWMLSDKLKGEAQTDQDGVLELTAKTPPAADFKKVQISIKGQVFDVKLAPANMILSLPVNLCKTK